MKREKKLATAMVSLFIDDEQKKLYDKLHDLELSHKRLKKLVSAFVKAAHSEKMDMNYFGRLVMHAEMELAYPYKRCNWGYTHKQEPGHYCE